MNSKKFFDWCRTAVSSIKHWPQKDKIHKELYDHLEDRYTAFREEGYDHEASEDKTIDIMGDANEVAKELAKNYKPIWPKLLTVTRYGIAASFIFAVSIVLLFVRVDDIMPITQMDMIFRNYSNFSQDTNVTQRANDYKMTVTRIAFEPYMRDYSEWYTMGHLDDTLLVEMVVTHPQIWICPPEELTFWAKDNRGNRYQVGAYYDSSCGEEPLVHSGLFQYTYQLQIGQIDAKRLDWIELYTQYEGKSLVWRIDLPGGGS